MIRYIFDDHRVGANSHVRTDTDGTEDLRSCPYEDIVAKNRRLLSFGADGDLMFDFDVTAAPDRTVDHDSLAVNQNKATAELRSPPDNAAPQNIQLVKDHGENA